MTVITGPWTNAPTDDAAQELTATRLNAMVLTQDVFANRPATGRDGQLFYATDTGRLYVWAEDAGPAAWEQVFSENGSPSIPGIRSLAVASNQAAAGNHTH